MQWRSVAVATCVAALAVAAPVPAGTPLTLDTAFARVLEQHPDLRIFAARRTALTARVEQAAQSPALSLGLDVENVLGSGDLRGVRSAELTLSLASVLERGGKLDARRALAQSEVDALAIEREKQRLDLLAETARRYLSVVSAREVAAIAAADIALRQQAVDDASRRHRAGALPRSAVLAAEAALARAELDQKRAEQQRLATRRHLAALWGEHAPGFAVAAADPYALPPLPEFARLAGWLERTPEVSVFADRQRIAEARVRLARSAAVADMDWQLGVRRVQASGDYGLVASVSIPLGSSGRAQPGIRAARAELEALSIRREAAGMALYTTLADAHGRYRVARLEVQRLGEDVLPRLQAARDSAAQAWRAGAASRVEWAQLQNQCIEVRHQRLASAMAAHRALIEIQRLTGQPFVTGAASVTSAARNTP